MSLPSSLLLVTKSSFLFFSAVDDSAPALGERLGGAPVQTLWPLFCKQQKLELPLSERPVARLSASSALPRLESCGAGALA